MKTIRSINWRAIGLSVLMSMAAASAVADQPATTPSEGKNYTGTVVSIDTKEHVLNVKGWLGFKKSFNLGDGCAYVMLEKNPAAVGDLRAGEKVVVTYQDAHGVLIASRVEQEPMRYEGMIKTIDADKQSLVLHASGFDRQLRLADDYKILLRDGRAGTLADFKIGNHVTVTYESPESGLIARQIAQTSIEFSGTLTAIDLGEQTVKAKSLLVTKKFNVADNCAIVIRGKTDGSLSDLKPNDKLVISYDEIHGVNVANRIAPVETTQSAQTNSVAAAGSTSGY